MTQDPERPSPADQPADRPADRPGAQTDGTAPPSARIDESAAESGQPADMAYYRVPARSGAMMLLGTIAIPLAVIVGIAVVLLIAL
ncbi:hypothetical protein TW83_05835 [Paracoccus sp. S4493]|uniref:hypothetical protein n=1 Tax=unclassified Paracoccus (in: a-proteobacteria) TaxID=2688777 RepID=UPI0005FA66ED|nr:MULTISPECIES: hypothetical protein [unclassified Paracoccus (in: a-proteobacteria)]KJZ31978.1 hypothetical protein TW83_05835 [Paracoccus sp. S4493]MCO6362247.1 hypothetical protein [Paracoccus sp. 08]